MSDEFDAGVGHVTMGIALLLMGEGLVLANQVGGDVPHLLSVAASTALMVSGLWAIGTRVYIDFREAIADAE